MSQTLLTIISSTSLERPLIDWFLQKEEALGFTSVSTYGHGSEPDSLTLIEQVEGRKKQIMLQIQMPLAKANIIIHDLKIDFNKAEIHYWLVPIIQAGKITSDK
jgi:hypothetical protein